MALWDIDNLEAAATSSKSASQGKKEIIEGAYHLQLESIEAAKSQKGEDKWIIKWLAIAAPEQDQIEQSVGARKIEHFVIGHAKPDVAINYKKDLLLRLKLLGIDLEAIRNEGDLFMAAKDLTAAQPVMTYYLKPQESNPQYLNWYPKGKLSADGSFTIGLDGKQLSKWGEAAGGAEAPEVVENASAPMPVDAAPKKDGLPF